LTSKDLSSASFDPPGPLAVAAAVRFRSPSALTAPSRGRPSPGASFGAVAATPPHRSSTSEIVAVPRLTATDLNSTIPPLWTLLLLTWRVTTSFGEPACVPSPTEGAIASTDPSEAKSAKISRSPKSNSGSNPGSYPDPRDWPAPPLSPLPSDLVSKSSKPESISSKSRSRLISCRSGIAPDLLVDEVDLLAVS